MTKENGNLVVVVIKSKRQYVCTLRKSHFEVKGMMWCNTNEYLKIMHALKEIFLIEDESFAQSNIQ